MVLGDCIQMRGCASLSSDMSRQVIINLAAGDFDEKSAEGADFLKRIAGGISPKYSSEWQNIVGGGERWRQRAALVMLGVMSRPGPQGGKPPLQAIVAGMLKSEKVADAIKDDAEWRDYFFKVFYREQKKYIDSECGSGADGELRRRLLKAFLKAGASVVEKGYYGMPGAISFEVDHGEAIEVLGQRTPKGGTAVHSAMLPTVGDLKAMISDFFDEFPLVAPPFGSWVYIAKSVFRCVPSEATGGSPIEENRDEWDDIATSTEDGRDIVSGADVDDMIEEIARLITELDGGTPFPNGRHGRTFVEFLIWSDKQGENSLRCTAEQYAARVTFSNTSITNYQNAIFSSLAGSESLTFDSDPWSAVFLKLQEKYLSRHLEVFGKPPLGGEDEPSDDMNEP